MGDHEKYRIDEIAADGQPIAPEDVKTKFIKQCGVVVREYIPITFREWHSQTGQEFLMSDPKAKKSFGKGSRLIS